MPAALGRLGRTAVTSKVDGWFELPGAVSQPGGPRSPGFAGADVECSAWVRSPLAISCQVQLAVDVGRKRGWCIFTANRLEAVTRCGFTACWFLACVIDFPPAGVSALCGPGHGPASLPALPGLTLEPGYSLPVQLMLASGGMPALRTPRVASARYRASGRDSYSGGATSSTLPLEPGIVRTSASSTAACGDPHP